MKPKSKWAPLRPSTFIFDEWSDHVNYLCVLAAVEAKPHQHPWHGVE